MGKEFTCNAGDTRDSGSVPGGGQGNLLQYSCLESPMDRGAWWATVHGVTKYLTRLMILGKHTWTHTCWNYSCVVREDISGSFDFVFLGWALAEVKSKTKCSFFLFLNFAFFLYKINSRVLLSHKKEENNAICRNMNGPRDCHIEWSKEDKHHMILLICEI